MSNLQLGHLALLPPSQVPNPNWKLQTKACRTLLLSSDWHALLCTRCHFSCLSNLLFRWYLRKSAWVCTNIHVLQFPVHLVSLQDGSKCFSCTFRKFQVLMDRGTYDKNPQWMQGFFLRALEVATQRFIAEMTNQWRHKLTSSCSLRSILVIDLFGDLHRFFHLKTVLVLQVYC